MVILLVNYPKKGIAMPSREEKALLKSKFLFLSERESVTKETQSAAFVWSYHRYKITILKNQYGERGSYSLLSIKDLWALWKTYKHALRESLKTAPQDISEDRDFLPPIFVTPGVLEKRLAGKTFVGVQEKIGILEIRFSDCQVTVYAQNCSQLTYELHEE